MTIKDVIKQKGSKVHTVKPDQNLREALRVIVTHRIGAMPVCDERCEVLGMLSERDILRVCYSSPDGWHSIQVKDVMSPNIICVTPESRVEDVMSIMTEKRIRHLPVFERSKLSGIVSIGDVVKSVLEMSSDELKHMKDYLMSA